MNKEEILARKYKLSPAKRAFLEKRLRGEVESDSRSSIISQRFSDKPVPLSFAQQRLWFLQQLELDNPFYNESVAIQLTGSLDVAALEQSLNEIMQRHEALRTTFKMVKGQPVQVIIPNLSMTLSVVELCELPEAGQKTEVQRLATEQSQRPFNLAQTPLLRWTLLQLSEQKHVLLLTVHHIVFDGWSGSIFMRELSALYTAFSTEKPTSLPDLPIQYADFAVWQKQWLQGEVLKTQLAYWKNQLGTNPPVLELPTDHPPPYVPTFQGTKQFFTLSPTLIKKIKILSQRESATLFMTLLGAFKVLLHSYKGQEDILVGSPIANRNRTETEGLIGFFVNTLVLRTNLSGNPSFREVLGRVREVTLGAYAHQDLPFDKLVTDLQPERNLNSNPFFQTWFVLQNAPTPALELRDLTLNLELIETGVVRHDLKLNLTETPEGLKGFFEYKTDLFAASTIAQMAELFETVLTEIVQQPDIELRTLKTILAGVQKQQQLSQSKAFKAARRQKIRKINRRVVSE
ncbi:condensation protein [Pleurocapsales cyanobacterium LEGE 06147]|nr:condensation protein [Pleurocapsales cyanobacterium LEGE 06147]